MPHVVVLSTGGTISSRPSTGRGVVSTDGAAELVGRVALPPDHTLETVDVLRVGSYRLSLGDLRTLADAVQAQLARDDVDGVVVTHGTDTLEESAVLLDLVHHDERPVVLTGAQRSADQPDGDGPRNLRDAIVVAGSLAARGLGVVVVFSGLVLPARGTRKMHTTALSPFRALDGGPVGDVDAEGVRIAARPVRPVPLAAPGAGLDDVRVDLVEVYPGADASLMDAAVAAGARGVVLAGTGIGNANDAIVDAVRRHVGAGVSVVLSSRVPEGPVVPVYGDGGGVDLLAAGAVVAGDLPATQVRVLLALALSHTTDATEVAELVRSAG